MTDTNDPTAIPGDESGPQELPASAAPGEVAGDRIGPYELIETVGEGGMGSVWRAEQTEPVKRLVALKVIKLGMDTREVVARFEAERQALALMDHPQIAKVFDAGVTGSGRPYFVMELVDGVPITQYCNDAKMGLNERLELFVNVCEAIQHAHHKGIIHRDVKPSNILVSLQDGKVAPKVIDFGIAKATESELPQATLQTQFGQIIGTPEYMAPEQAEVGGRDIDTRADVYSLGVLLYELLTGTKPFDLKKLLESGIHELLRTIREEDPAKPSTRVSSLGESATSIAVERRVDTTTLNKRLRGDLDWIVMKALEKDRDRRYDTASSFAADIARYLRNEPVSAAPPSASYRLSKFLQRRKRVVAAITTITTLLIVGSVGTGIGWWKTQLANAQLDVALGEKAEALKEEERQRRLAQDNEQRARDAEEQARAEAKRATAAEGKATARARELEQVAAFQERQLSDVDVELMGARLEAALVAAAPEDQRSAWKEQLAELNFTNIALDSLRQNLFERTVDAIDTQFADQPAIRVRLLRSTGTTMSNLGLLDMAVDPLQRSVEIASENLGEDHRFTLMGMNDLALVRERRDESDQAQALYEQAYAGFQNTLGPDDPESLRTLHNLATLFEGKQQYARAENALREVLAGRRRILGNDHKNTLTTINNLAVLLNRQGKVSEAEQLYREALDGTRRTLGEDDIYTLGAINNMGLFLLGLGRTEEAEAYLRDAVRGVRRVLGDEHHQTLTLISNLGIVLRDEGRLAEAEPLLREALETRLRVLGEDNYNTYDSMVALGQVLEAQGKLEEAQELFTRGVAGLRRRFGDQDSHTRKWIDKLHDLLRDQVSSARSTGDGVNIGLALSELGRFVGSLGQFNEAELLLGEALERLLADGDVSPWRTQAELALAIAGQGRFDEAEFMLLEAVDELVATAKVGNESDRAAAREALQKTAEFYGAWHAAVPRLRHDATAAAWRARLETLNAKSD